MRPETWKLVRSVSRVVGFLGNLNPKYLSEEEYQAMIENIKTKVAHVAVAELHVGDMVRIIDGSFQSLSGKVKTLLPDKKKIEIVVKIFDRETTIDIEISKIEKIDTNN
jgi:transcriptional antiterminator NusG